jgi:hypothetical protein
LAAPFRERPVRVALRIVPRNAPGAGHSGWTEDIMRKLATALAVAFATVSARAAFACEGEKVQSADQSQQKPAVAEKTQKETKQQQKKAKKGERAEKAPVARADNG